MQGLSLLKNHHATKERMARFLRGRTVAALGAFEKMDRLQKDWHVIWTAPNATHLSALRSKDGLQWLVRERRGTREALLCSSRCGTVVVTSRQSLNTGRRGHVASTSIGAAA